MKIAIIGAGFAGLSLAWHLQKECHVTVFEEGDLSPSSFAAGLLHKFAGHFARKSSDADIALEKSRHFISSFGADLLTPLPLYRIPLDAHQKSECENRALQFPDELTFIEERQALMIQEAWKVDCREYITRMKKGLTIEQKKICRLDELSEFTAICIAAGPGSLQLIPSELELRVSTVKGQLLIAMSEPDIEEALLGKVYLLPDKKKDQLIIGATYERGEGWVDARAVLGAGAKELLNKDLSLSCAKVLQGIRVTTSSRLPLIGKVTSNLFVFTGLGSKGLLYHALYAERLAALMRSSLLEA